MPHSLFKYMLNNIGDKQLPCLTTLLILYNEISYSSVLLEIDYLFEA